MKVYQDNKTLDKGNPYIHFFNHLPVKIFPDLRITGKISISDMMVYEFRLKM